MNEGYGPQHSQRPAHFAMFWVAGLSSCEVHYSDQVGLTLHNCSMHFCRIQCCSISGIAYPKTVAARLALQALLTSLLE